MDAVEFIEEIYGIELLQCQKELLRRYAEKKDICRTIIACGLWLRVTLG